MNWIHRQMKSHCNLCAAIVPASDVFTRICIGVDAHTISIDTRSRAPRKTRIFFRCASPLLVFPDLSPPLRLLSTLSKAHTKLRTLKLTFLPIVGILSARFSNIENKWKWQTRLCDPFYPAPKCKQSPSASIYITAIIYRYLMCAHTICAVANALTHMHSFGSFPLPFCVCVCFRGKLSSAFFTFHFGLMLIAIVLL